MPSAVAIFAHPDDIEFVAAGTMLALKERGWDLHYMNIANGSKGSSVLGPDDCAAARLAEAKVAAAAMGAAFYQPICADLEIAYTQENLKKIASVVRQSQASIVLTHSPVDYMEDHEITCRLAVTAAFTHSMPNFESIPDYASYSLPVTVYHAQPHGNHFPMGEAAIPHFYVDITDKISDKRNALACHVSQKAWLDESQAMDSFLMAMEACSREVGQWSGRFEYAEGWRKRRHTGFCGPDDDPLRAALADRIVESSDQ